MKKKIRPVRATLLPKPMFSVVTEDFAAMLKECNTMDIIDTLPDGVVGAFGGCLFIGERMS